MPHQVSVFLENKPGKLEKVTSLLSAAEINIRAITIADNGDFGVLKLLVNDPGKSYDILVKNGLAAALQEVVAVKINDRPGGLNKIARVLVDHQFNIDDAYGFVLKSGQTAVFVLQVEEPAAAGAALRNAGMTLLEEKDLYYL